MPRFIRVRSRNSSANLLRNKVRCVRPTIVRLGSFTETERIFNSDQIRAGVVEINTVNSCKNSNDKLLMKQCFERASVPTANWAQLSNTTQMNDEFIRIQNPTGTYTQLRYPLIIKNRHSSRGRGIYYVANQTDYLRLKRELTGTAHIIEEYKNYAKEYRIHASTIGAFYANRKMLLNDTADENRFHRHHENTVWLVPENPEFDEPTNWTEICDAARAAIVSVGLTIGCIDLKVQLNRNNPPSYIVLETNSGPALGECTAPEYIEELNELVAILR